MALKHPQRVRCVVPQQVDGDCAEISDVGHGRDALSDDRRILDRTTSHSGRHRDLAKDWGCLGHCRAGQKPTVETPKPRASSRLDAQAADGNRASRKLNARFSHGDRSNKRCCLDQPARHLERFSFGPWQFAPLTSSFRRGGNYLYLFGRLHSAKGEPCLSPQPSSQSIASRSFHASVSLPHDVSVRIGVLRCGQRACEKRASVMRVFRTIAPVLAIAVRYRDVLIGRREVLRNEAEAVARFP